MQHESWPGFVYHISSSSHRCWPRCWSVSPALVRNPVFSLASNTFSCVQAWWRTRLVPRTGSQTRTSTPAASARGSSRPASPSTTAAPADRACVTTAPRSAAPCRPGAGTTPSGSATAATRSLGSSSRTRTETGSRSHWALPKLQILPRISQNVYYT